MYIKNPLHSVLRDPLPRQADGRIGMPEGPGLGVRLDDAELARYGRGWRISAG